MNTWRDAILKDFVPRVSRLTLVADPDSLLTEEKLVLELRRRGFELIEFNDPVEFRYAYESKYRMIWDQGEGTDLVVILRLRDAGLECLPYDLLQAGRKLSFNLGDLFPRLSYPVIETLDRSLLDALHDAQRNSSSEPMGDNATRDFTLRHVFSITAELITNEVELLRALLRLHYGKIQLPLALVERLVQVLRDQGDFNAWPLDEIVRDEEAFFAFLQERWPVFLGGLNREKQTREDLPEYSLKYSGPSHLPFAHDDIRVYIDNLFVEGKLVPVVAADIGEEAGAWVRSGIVSAGADDENLRITRLFELVKEEWPNEESRYSDWTAFALKWAELSSLVHCGSNAGYRSRLEEAGDALNAVFAGWLGVHYASLSSLPPTSLAMLHQAPRCLAREVESPANRRVALIVVDGLALDQWVTVRRHLQDQNSSLVMRESATFAWIPTLTSVSRQSIFSGRPPFYFPSSIKSTNSEEKLWKRFWESQGISPRDVAYQRSLGDGDVSRVLNATIHPNKTRVVGLVVDKVDKIMHGMQLGSPGMHNQIKQWCEDGFLGALIAHLLDHGFVVWLTSDHGNIQGCGKGRPTEGVLAETRGERVRVYPTPELRSQVAAEFTFAHEWQPVGLPAEYFPLVAGGRDAFVKPGESIVGHGGIAMEEVIVPLVKFARRGR